MKNKLSILILIFILSFIPIGSLQAIGSLQTDINPVNIDELDEKTIISDYDLNFKIGNDMKLLYFELIDDGRQLYGYGYVKNTSDKTIYDSNFGCIDDYTGYTEDGKTLFGAFTATGHHLFIEPNEIVPIEFIKHYGDNKEMLKYLDVIKYKKNYRYKDPKKIEGLYLTDIIHDGYNINLRLANETDDKFFESSEIHILFMYYNENNEIIGWSSDASYETIVPNSSRDFSTFTSLADKYTESNVIQLIKDKGSIKIFSSVNISKEFKEKFNIKKEEN